MHELVWSDGLRQEAMAARDEVEAALVALGVGGELVLTGALSVAGVLTRGDVDLHLRVEPRAFDGAVERVRAAYPVASPGAWAPTLAVFEVPRRRATGLAVTPLHSEHDRRFRLAWDALRRDPALVVEDNALTSGSVDSADDEARKSRFFGAISGT